MSSEEPPETALMTPTETALSTSPPMPHDYTLGEAVIDNARAHWALFLLGAMVLLLATGAIMSIDLASGVMMGVIWSVIGGALVVFGGFEQLEKERRRRRVALMEDAVARSSIELSEAEERALQGPMSRPQRLALRVGVIARENRTMLFASAGLVAMIGAGGALSDGADAGLICGGTSAFVYGLAIALLFLRDLVAPSQDARRELEATEHFRQTVLATKDADLQGAVSIASGEGDDARRGGLSMSTEKGALTQADD